MLAKIKFSRTFSNLQYQLGHDYQNLMLVLIFIWLNQFKLLITCKSMNNFLIVQNLAKFGSGDYHLIGSYSKFHVFFTIDLSGQKLINQRTIGPENTHLKPGLGAFGHNEMTLTLNNL